MRGFPRACFPLGPPPPPSPAPAQRSRRPDRETQEPGAIKLFFLPSFRGPARAALALALLAGLGGCKLIDQTTFAAAPPAQALLAAPPAKLRGARRPLLVIGADATPDAYAPVLRLAVRAAERRDPTVRFDVTAVAPAAHPAETDAAEAAALQVMRAIGAEGVPANRILLRVTLDPGVAIREVRVYVR